MLRLACHCQCVIRITVRPDGWQSSCRGSSGSIAAAGRDTLLRVSRSHDENHQPKKDSTFIGPLARKARFAGCAVCACQRIYRLIVPSSKLLCHSGLRNAICRHQPGSQPAGRLRRSGSGHGPGHRRRQGSGYLGSSGRMAGQDNGRLGSPHLGGW